jgi:hypothetical protein
MDSPNVGKKVNHRQIDDPTNVSAFKITLITKENYNTLKIIDGIGKNKNKIVTKQCMCTHTTLVFF